MGSLHLLLFLGFITLTQCQISGTPGDGLYGWCGTKPDDTFTFLDDAERPFCFKFMGANSDSDTPYYYYYFGTRVDVYTLVTLQACT